MQVLKNTFEDFSINNSDTELAKIVTYILGESLKNIKSILDFDKVGRDDVAEYKIKVLQRQQVINEKLVSFGQIKEGYKVLDACCGPEGSSLSVLKRGAEWYGNEISQKTYEHLLELGLNVENGTAEELKFDSDKFNYVIYCYAINNIQATLKVIEEGNRVLKSNGKILVADPGITMWLSDIILYSIKEFIENDYLELKKISINTKRFQEKIPEYFKTKKINSNEYTDFLINGLLGIHREVLLQQFSEVTDYLLKRYKKSNKKIDIYRVSNYFHKYINSLYWENIITSSKISGMEIEKCSFYNCFRKKGNEDWNFTDILDINLKNKSSKEIRDIFMKLQLPNEKNSEKLLIGKKGIQNLLPTVMFSLKKQ